MIQPCVSINRGIYTAATQGGANFSLDFTFTYPSGGGLVQKAVTLPVSEMHLVGDDPADSSHRLVDTRIDLTQRPDPGVEIRGTVRVVTPSGGSIG